MPTVSVVIPALNEARNLPHVLPHLPADVHEVILVDGRSVDGTIQTARRLLPSVRVVLEPKRGKGAALWAGFRAATGDIVVMLDADGSTDPREIPAFVAALAAGADYAKGSRFIPPGGTSDMSPLRALGNYGFVLLVRVLFRARYTDLCYGYNAFWRRVLPQLESDCQGFEVETVLNLRAAAAGLRITEVPSFESRRIYGTSNLRTFRDGWAVLKTILRERFANRPLPAVAGSRLPHRADLQPIVVSSIAPRPLDERVGPAGPGGEAAGHREPAGTPAGAVPVEPGLVTLRARPAGPATVALGGRAGLAAVVADWETAGPHAPVPAARSGERPRLVVAGAPGSPRNGSAGGVEVRPR